MMVFDSYMICSSSSFVMSMFVISCFTSGLFCSAGIRSSSAGMSSLR